MVVSDWLEQIGECIRFKEMTVWFSTSYMMFNSASELVYVYTCKETSMFHTKLSTKVRKRPLMIIFWNILEYSEYIIQDEWTERFVNHFKYKVGQTEWELMEAQIAAEDHNAFVSSGFRPYKIIAYNVWIKK